MLPSQQPLARSKCSERRGGSGGQLVRKWTLRSVAIYVCVCVCASVTLNSTFEAHSSCPNHTRSIVVKGRNEQWSLN